MWRHIETPNETYIEQNQVVNAVEHNERILKKTRVMPVSIIFYVAAPQSQARDFLFDLT